jgi:starch phosphorylase
VHGCCPRETTQGYTPTRTGAGRHGPRSSHQHSAALARAEPARDAGAVSDALHEWISQDVIETLGLPAAGARGRDLAARVDQVKTRALWNLRARAREAMVEALRARGLPAADSDALWIGWAGDIGEATRPTLVLRDHARLERLLDDPLNAVRMVMTGAPTGAGGGALHERLAEVSDSARFEGRLLYLPGDDPELARVLIQGVDLWLTTAARGSEAGRRAAARAAANGAINLATATSWWAELDHADAGWTLGGPRAFDEQDAQDEHDARALYELLETSVVPAFYEWDGEGVPQRWVERIRASMRTIPAALDDAE